MRIIRSLLVFICCCMCCCIGLGRATPAQAQTAEIDAVRAVIDRLFDGMRAGDSTAVRSVFAPSARLVTVVMEEGKPRVRESPLDGFIEAVGTPHEAVWDERIRDVEIRVDGPMASAWVPYAFYLGETLSHCGVNTFQLYLTGPEWKVFHLADTRRREPCARF
jgi:hypothetical protein